MYLFYCKKSPIINSIFFFYFIAKDIKCLKVNKKNNKHNKRNKKKMKKERIRRRSKTREFVERTPFDAANTHITSYASIFLRQNWVVPTHYCFFSALVLCHTHTFTQISTNYCVCLCGFHYYLFTIR